MNIALKSALASAVIVLAHACATPVEIGDDVLLANPNDFGDAGPLGGAAGDGGQGGASPGGSNTNVGGAGSVTAGAGSGGAGVTGMPVGLAGVGGLPGAAGNGGGPTTGTGGSSVIGGSGGSGGTGAGTAGSASTAGTGGTGGSGGTGSAAVFDPSSCDFDDTTGCEALACEARCPTNDGNSCLSRCVPVVNCVADAVAESPASPCVTEDDPLCGGRDGGTPRECTGLVDSAGGLNASGANEPAFVAREFVECICSVPRP